METLTKTKQVNLKLCRSIIRHLLPTMIITRGKARNKYILYVFHHPIIHFFVSDLVDRVNVAQTWDALVLWTVCWQHIL